MKKERKNRTAAQLIADLQGRIEAVRAREERKRVNADPGRRHAKLALAALRRAIGQSSDDALKAGLTELLPAVERCVETTPVEAATPGLPRKPRAGRAQGVS